MFSRIKEIFSYRTMIASLIRRDLRGRYKGSVLGFAWTFLNPLLQLLVYTMVFSVVLRVEIDRFYMFLFVALIPWIFFSSSLTGGADCVIAQKDMVQKIYFPREVLPLSHVTSQFVNMLLSFVIVFAALLISGIGIKPGLLWYLVPVMLAEYLFALGIAFVTSAVTVYFRDLSHVLPVLTLAWQFLTPIMYPIEAVPDEMLGFFRINPMTSVIAGYRDVLYYQRAPELSTLLGAAGAGLLFLLFGWFLFQRLQRHFAELL